MGLRGLHQGLYYTSLELAVTKNRKRTMGDLRLRKVISEKRSETGDGDANTSPESLPPQKTWLDNPFVLGLLCVFVAVSAFGIAHVMSQSVLANLKLGIERERLARMQVQPGRSF